MLFHVTFRAARMRVREKKERKKRTSGVIHTTGLEEDATGSGVDTENKLHGGTLHVSNEMCGGKRDAMIRKWKMEEYVSKDEREKRDGDAREVKM